MDPSIGNDIAAGCWVVVIASAIGGWLVISGLAWLFQHVALSFHLH